MSVILAFCCDILLKYISRGLNEGLIGICHLRVENVKLCEQMREKSTGTFKDCDAGVPIRYRFDDKLLNLRRLQAKFKV